MLISARNPVRKTRVIVSYQGTITSSAGGVISGVYGMNPVSYDDWTNFAALYDQFRVLGGRINFACACPNAAVNGGLIRFAFDNDSSATPTSYSDITGYSEVKDIQACWSGGQIQKFDFKRPVTRGLPDSQQIWYDEASPSASPGAVKFYGSGFSASTLYMNVIVDLLVEFQIRS